MEKKPVDWDELYPGRFLKAGDFQGKDVTLTISAVDLEELEGDTGKKVKGVLSFNETRRQLALNKTNGICFREMFGRQVQEWCGRKVTLTPEAWNGDIAIRVKGSPELEGDRTIEVKLPRKRPQQRTLYATGKAAE
jgi:hypothetical protein